MEIDNKHLKFTQSDRSIRHLKLGSTTQIQFCLHKFGEIDCKPSQLSQLFDIKIYKNINKLYHGGGADSGKKNYLQYKLQEVTTEQDVKFYTIDFKPSEIGTYNCDIGLKRSAHLIENLTSSVKIYDASEICVFLQLNEGDQKLVRLIRDNFDSLNPQHFFPIGKEIQLKVDASRAGEGQLEISICDGEIPNQVRILKNEEISPGENKNNLNLLITFTPEEIKSHKIDIKFNSETIPDCPIILSNFHSAPMGNIYDDIAPPTSSMSPSMSSSPSTSAIIELQTVNLTKKLELLGLGELVKFDIVVNEKLQGVPVDTGRKNFFKILIKEPSAALDSEPGSSTDALLPVKIDLLRKDRSPNGLWDKYTYTVQFRTKIVGPHAIEIFPCSTSISMKTEGGDFLKQFLLTSKIYDPSKVRISLVQGIFTHADDKVRNNYCFKIGQEVQFNVDASEAGEGNLEITITTILDNRNNKNVPTRVHPLPSAGPGHPEQGARFMVTFLPLEPHDHLITITFNKNPIKGWTPFSLKPFFLFENLESSKPPKLIPVSQLSQGQVGQSQVTKNMSYYYLSGKILENHAAPLGEITRFYLKERKRRKSSQNFDSGKRLSEEDFKILIENPSASTTSKVDLKIKLVQDNFDLDVDDDVQEIERNVAEIEWIPQVTGEHKISFSVFGGDFGVGGVTDQMNNEEMKKGMGKFIPCKVYDVKAIRVSNIGSLLLGLLGKPFTFIVETQNAGPGNLEVTVNNGQVPTSAQAQGPNTYAISFTPKESHLHFIELRFNGEDIPGSPFKVDIVDASKIRLVYMSTQPGQQIEKVSVGRPVKFYIESQNEILNNLLGSNLDNLLNFFDIIVVNGSSRNKIPSKITRKINPEFKYEIEFVPEEVGDHVVEVNLRNNYGTNTLSGSSASDGDGEEDGKFIQTQSIPGSPLMLKSYDSNRVKVSFPDNFNGDGEASLVEQSNKSLILGLHGKPFYFFIDASGAGAGNLEIIVSVTNQAGTDQRNIPNYVQAEGGAKFRVNFRPNLFHDEDGQELDEFDSKNITNHYISVKFNGEPVPYSPFKCHVIDLSRIQLVPFGTHPSSNYTIDEPIGFQILDFNSHLMTQFSTTSEDYLEIFKRIFQIQILTPTLLAPSGNYNIVQNEKKILILDFLPGEIGPHVLQIFCQLNGQLNHITSSPQNFNVFNIDRIRVIGLKDEETGTNRVLRKGKSLTFTVDASEAGEGTLELIVTNSKQKSLRAEVVTNNSSKRGVYDVTFHPEIEDDSDTIHFVTITFNDCHVNGSPFECRFDTDMINNENFYDIINSTGSLNGSMANDNSSFMDDLIEELKIMEIFLDSENDEKKIYINPREIKVKLLNNFKNDTEGVYEVEEINEDLVNNVLFLEFQVDLTDSVALGTIQNVKFNKLKKNLIMKNLQKLITKESMKNLFQFEILKLIHDPSKKSSPIQFEPIPHNITIEKLSNKISSSVSELNFKIKLNFQMSKQSHYRIEPLYKNKFKISQNPINLSLIKSSQMNKHLKGTKGQGQGGQGQKNFYRDLIDLKIVKFTRIPKSKIGHKLVFEVDNFSNLDKMEFTLDTNRLVDHVNNVNYNRGHNVSPFSQLKLSTNDVIDVIVNDRGSGFGVPLKCFNVTTNSTNQELLLKVEFDVGHSKLKSFDILIYFKGKLLHELLQSEESQMIKHELLMVQFYDLTSIDFKINNFTLKATKPTEKFKIINSNDKIILEVLEQLAEIDQKTKLTIDCTIDQGSEELDLVQKANWAQLEILKSGQVYDESIDIRKRSYIPQEICGLVYKFEMRLSEIFDFENLKNSSGGSGIFSKFLIRGGKSSKSFVEIPVKIVMKGMQQKLVNQNYYYEKIAEDAEGKILTNRVENMKISTPPVIAQQMGGGKKFSSIEDEAEIMMEIKPKVNSRRIPAQPGPGVPVRHVSELVQCTGEGLRVGTVGKDIKSFIDTRKSGAGELTAQCHSLSNPGPDGVLRNAYCELYDHGDGTFTLNVRPQEPGKHSLSIKYSGEHVPGSPYTLRVAGLPDPSKVRVWGPGIEHGVLATFQSRFICDTRGAGAGQLTVRVRGPKGAFRVEMQRESPRDRTILCKFDPTEPGDYRVEVKWAGDHVPGSPFTVFIVDTQEELQRYCQMTQQQQQVQP